MPFPGINEIVALDNINQCVSSPCQNDGLCIDGDYKYTCQCIPGFRGYNCEIAPSTDGMLYSEWEIVWNMVL